MELEKLLNKKTRKKRDLYFDIEVNDAHYVTGYQRKEAAIETAFKLCGVFGLISNCEDLTAQDALEAYRRRDSIEKHYDGMKNHLEFNRLKTHHQQSTDGKFFIGFIAQILMAHIQNKLSQAEKAPVASLKGLIIELDKLHRIEKDDGSFSLTSLTRKQKDILEIFDIDREDFLNSF